jgi:FtsP/CotA-like multicopper oxidase with cupredoxin domain
MGMDHGSHGQMDMSKMDHGSDQPVNMANMNHSQHQMPQGKAPVTTKQKIAMDHRSHEKMDMSKMDHSGHGQMDMSKMDHNAYTQMTMGEMDHSQHHMVVYSEKITSDTVQGWANAATPIGQKALTYADLKSLQSQPERYSRPAERELVIRLGGTMERYIWTIDGKKFSDPDFKPLTVRYGERIRLKFVNESMMAHPMHLHGMFM